ncbi:MAG: reverse transcriptase-like protein [Armatimonadota bacterium]|nr:reverse transcriptase-like protein [Armatimonadota bacterium]MDR5702036.1 reverse transcriptase-like protein [Armatimonadota bacterium]MDR7434666.1 reverse transcriptase-like protein [Armatimonadota bacterium]
MMKISIYATGIQEDGRGAIGLVLKDEVGQPIRRLGRTFDIQGAQPSMPSGKMSEVALGYRAILHGLWRARKLGAKHVEIFCDLTTVVEQVNGLAEVTPEFIGSYLQVRALLNAFRRSSVRAIPREQNREALSAADAALNPSPPRVDDLPLWASLR